MKQDSSLQRVWSGYHHNHPPVKNVNEGFDKQKTRGERIADWVAALAGSWPFIIVQSIVFVIWLGLNTYLVISVHSHPGGPRAWDPYPFILLNLVLSFQAAYTGPVVMMSQNRMAMRDRMMAESDYEVNQKAEEEIKLIMEHLIVLDKKITSIALRSDGVTPTPDGTP